MTEIAREILPVNLEDEMRQSYLDYAMSVIVGRALPDVRDGLKPVHRRVLYAMRELGNDYNKRLQEVGARRRRRHRQVPPARRHGGVRHHRAHGAAVLDALPAGRRPGQFRLGRRRCAGGHALHRSAHVANSRTNCWPTSTRKPSISCRTTTSRRHEPSVLPTRVPNLLVNGSSGIAVGMATNIPPHNLTEIVNACLALLDDPAISLAGLMQHRARARTSRPPASSTVRRKSPPPTRPAAAACRSARAPASRRSTARAAARRSSSPSCPTR